MSVRILEGDALQVLQTLPDCSVQMCVTSPPYFGLRDYGVLGQLGLEKTPDLYVEAMVGVFREVKRVLRDDGTLWLNIGDSYAGSGKGGNPPDSPHQKQKTNRGSILPAGLHESARQGGAIGRAWVPAPAGYKQKDLIGIPWALAKALRDPYYTGRIKREADRVWMAAIMDAEGCISGFTHDRADGTGIRNGVNVCITNTCTIMLDNAARIWPASRHDHMTHGEGHLGVKDVFRWKPSGAENVGDFMAEIYPYLLTKKRQAMLGWNLMQFSKNGQKWGKSSRAAEVREKRDVLVRLISALNQGTPADIPSWVAEPTSMWEQGWYLRSDVIWSKPNPMPESVTDRPTKSHEYMFLLSKSPTYYYDAEAISQPAVCGILRDGFRGEAGAYVNQRGVPSNSAVRESVPRGGFDGKTNAMPGREAFRAITETRNARTVWSIATQPYSEAHFATFPPKLIEPCILAGSAKGQTVLDPFGGAGTTGLVADRLGRDALLIELNPKYAEMARRRIHSDNPLFGDVA